METGQQGGLAGFPVLFSCCACTALVSNLQFPSHIFLDTSCGGSQDAAIDFLTHTKT